MFGKKKKINPIESYKPEFGSAEEFLDAYNGEKNITIGKVDDLKIKICGDKKPCNEITIINDVQKSVDNQVVIPLLKEKTMSYIVYDPYNTYQNETIEMFENSGYDVQIVDIGNNDCLSRVNIFEIANITKNSYWLSVILSSSIKCSEDEKPVAHALLMSIMQYLIHTNNTIDIVSLYKVFKSVRNEETEIWRALQSCPGSQSEIVKVWKAPAEIRNSVYEKILNNFFKTAITKTNNPNIFAATAHKKNTVYYIKRIPKKYSYIVTILLFNIKMSNIVFNQGKPSTVLIDAMDSGWYNELLVRKIENEIGTNTGIINLQIRDSIGTPERPYVRDNQLVVFMQSEDEISKKYIIHSLKTKELISREELSNTVDGMLTKKKQRKNKESIVDQLLDVSAVSMEEFENMTDSIVIDTSKAVKPFRCNRMF